MRGWLLISATLVATSAARVSAQATCPLGIDAPSVVTVVASPASPDTVAFVVNPDCSSVRLQLLNDGATFKQKTIERVASIPSKTVAFTCEDCPLTAGFDLSAASSQLRDVSISGASATAFRDTIIPRSVKFVTISKTTIEFLNVDTLPPDLERLSMYETPLKTTISLPSALTSLHLTYGQLTSISFAMPASLTSLNLDDNPITVLMQENLPPALKDFSCQNCKLTSIAGLSWPATLSTLDLDGNPISKLDKITLPPQLTQFLCAGCGLTLVRGVKLPTSLTYLNLDGGKIKEFEIQSSDVAVLEKLVAQNFDPTAVNSKCSDSSAELRRIGRFKVCVISDERFKQRYSGSSDESPLSDVSSTSTSGSTSKSESSEESEGSSNTDNSGGDGDGGNGVSGDRPGAGGSTDPDDPSTGSRGGAGANAATSSSESSSSVTIIVVIVSVGVVSVLGLIGFRYLSKRRHQHDEGGKHFQALRSSINQSEDLTVITADGSHLSSHGSGHIWKRDIRWDPSLAPYRIELPQLKIGQLIARGGFGVIYKGEYNNEAVAIKRLAQAALMDEDKVFGFMDEIRMCATLKHPKIVAFIGVAWSSQRDISVVIEFMDGGDLYALLQKQPVPSSPQDWFQPWTMAKTMKSKALIARDVVEALVYLHSFSMPILHRDLKARNVLLDSDGNAKLSDFGISRELTVDVTMTSEVGTVAWIAPEVLRGDRYSEKADIYSLGVLLVEMDRCRHPYAGDMAENGSTVGSVSGTGLELKDARIAMLVGAGQLQPEVSADSPSSVKELVARCLCLEAGDRPSAEVVLQYLQHLG